MNNYLVLVRFNSPLAFGQRFKMEYRAKAYNRQQAELLVQQRTQGLDPLSIQAFPTHERTGEIID